MKTKRKPTFNVERAYCAGVSDSDGWSCERLGDPLMNLIPALVGGYSGQQIVKFAKNFTKLAQETEVRQ
jgi:hypothetical protein